MRPRKNGVRSYSAATVKSKTNKLAVTKGKSIAPGRVAFFLSSSFDYQASATDLSAVRRVVGDSLVRWIDVQVGTIIACALT